MSKDCLSCILYYPDDDPSEDGYCSLGPAPRRARERCERFSTVSKTDELKSDLIGLAQRVGEG